MWEYLLRLKLACFHERIDFFPSIVPHVERCFYFFWGCKTPRRHAVNLQALIWPWGFRTGKSRCIGTVEQKNRREIIIFNSFCDRFALALTIWSWVNNAVITESQAVVPLAPYMASTAHPCTVWRGCSCCCCWRFTRALLPVWPQLSSQPLRRILFPGEAECRLEERTWSFFSLSPGVNYDFPSKCEPRETVWMAIHQATCLHPPEQWKKVSREVTSTLTGCTGRLQESTSSGNFQNNCMRWRD